MPHHNVGAWAALGSQGPRPHLEYGSVHRQNRPTTHDKIENLRVEVRSGPVAGNPSCHIGRTPPILSRPTGSSGSSQRPLLKQGSIVSCRPLDYAVLPIRNIFVEQTGQMPRVAGRPFFIVMASGLLISFLDRHFTQYPSKAFLQT